MNHSRSLYCLLLLGLFLPGFSSCSPAPEYKAYNLQYGPAGNNTLDVYLPRGRDKHTPVLIFLHGGAWIAGDKAAWNDLQDSLLQRGIASINMNYRYADSTIHYPQLIEDIDKAIDFCEAKRKEWRMPGHRYVIGGHSAGGHLALLYGYRYDRLGRVAAVITAAGPTDLTDTGWLNYTEKDSMVITGIQQMTGAEYQAGQPLPQSYKEASPRFHIHRVPTLLLHGNEDSVVFYTQSQLLAQTLASAKVPYKLVTLKHIGHGLGPEMPLFLEEIETWSKTYGE